MEGLCSPCLESPLRVSTSSLSETARKRPSAAIATTTTNNNNRAQLLARHHLPLQPSAPQELELVELFGDRLLIKQPDQPLRVYDVSSMR